MLGTEKVILVVDGNIERQAFTQKILTNAGYDVLSASSAEEADALCDTQAVFDLVISAVVMDGGDTGIHLAEHIERSRRTNSTLLISHYHRDLLHMVPGFDRQRDFLSDPVHPKGIASASGLLALSLRCPEGLRTEPLPVPVNER